MADFVPAGFNNDKEEEPEEEEDEIEVDAFDFSFFPKKKEEKKAMIAWPNPYARVP